MPLYTVVFDYRGGTYIDQVRAADESQALRAWAAGLGIGQIQGIGPARQRRLIADIESLLRDAGPPVLLDSLVNAWCAGTVLGSGLVNLIRTETRV